MLFFDQSDLADKKPKYPKKRICKDLSNVTVLSIQIKKDMRFGPLENGDIECYTSSNCFIASIVKKNNLPFMIVKESTKGDVAEITILIKT